MTNSQQNEKDSRKRTDKQQGDAPKEKPGSVGGAGNPQTTRLEPEEQGGVSGP